MLVTVRFFSFTNNVFYHFQNKFIIQSHLVCRLQFLSNWNGLNFLSFGVELIGSCLKWILWIHNDVMTRLVACINPLPDD